LLRAESDAPHNRDADSEIKTNFFFARHDHAHDHAAITRCLIALFVSFAFLNIRIHIGRPAAGPFRGKISFVKQVGAHANLASPHIRLISSSGLRAASRYALRKSFAFSSINRFSEIRYRARVSWIFGAEN
jgi:hypothetical protein